MYIATTLGEFAGPHQKCAAFLALVGNLLPARISLNFVVMPHLWWGAEVGHGLLPWRAVANALPAVPNIGKQVSVLVNERVSELLFVRDDGSTQTDRADAVIGHAR